jgi:hypothetical protein
MHVTLTIHGACLFVTFNEHRFVEAQVAESHDAAVDAVVSEATNPSILCLSVVPDALTGSSKHVQVKLGSSLRDSPEELLRTRC